MTTLRISLVEDDAEARHIFAGWINTAKGVACCSEHGSAESALAALPALKPDVVFMDINLPGLSGIDCVRRLKPLLPTTQFVMLTVYEDSDHLFNALAAGASGYLLKRTTCNELLAAVRAVHGGASPMTGSIARRIVQYFHAAPPPANDAVRLTPREQNVLELLARGFLYKEIADALVISVLTVNSHVRSIYEKMHVRSRGQAVAMYANLNERCRPPGR
ncbi:MAG: response regulator transcription factor [Opitutae bacterium]|nr:response regulator transcription factor [Opitutae bacterium]